MLCVNTKRDFLRIRKLHKLAHLSAFTLAPCAPDFANMLCDLSASARIAMPRKRFNEAAQVAGRFLANGLGNLESQTAGEEQRSTV
jgi:hypothetical protein